jgi:ERCC4-related helicase
MEFPGFNSFNRNAADYFNCINSKMEFLEGISPREYQQRIFETCKGKNCLVVLPTGIGKTLIALMLAIERMKKFPGQKVVILAPTKPLAEQHYEYFRKHLPELFADIVLFTGRVKPEQRKEIWETADIVFSTPQCIANDLRKKMYNLKDVCLLVEDEAHRCIRNYDYNYVAGKYKEQAKHQRLLGLTASPGSEKEKINEICKNLSIEEVELRTRDSEDVKPYLQELNFEKIRIDFPPEFEEMKQVLLKLFNENIDELRKRRILFGPPSKIELLNTQKRLVNNISGSTNYNHWKGISLCAQAIKIQHALELLETQTLKSFSGYLKKLFEQAAKQQSKGVVKLVSRPEFNFVYTSSGELLSKKAEHPKIKKIEEIMQREKDENKNMKIIIFTQFRDTAEIISKKINEIKGINSKIFVGQAKKNGTGLNQKEQKKIIEEFSSGKTNVLVATSIGEEGLDIPEVNAVIFYEPIPSAIRAIQRAGRTARLMKGKLIVLITKKTRDETFYYVSRGRERKMHKTIDSIKKNLKYKNFNKKETQERL